MRCRCNPLLRIGRSERDAVRLGRRDRTARGDTIELRRRRVRRSAAPRVRRDLQARVQGELLQDVVDVSLLRIGGEVEALTDILVAQPVRVQIENRTLAFGLTYSVYQVRRSTCYRDNTLWSVE